MMLAGLCGYKGNLLGAHIILLLGKAPMKSFLSQETVSIFQEPTVEIERALGS
jgi:hypothetical protein